MFQKGWCSMSHETHDSHTHEHNEQCGHTRVRHDGHVDYLHEGHLHSPHGDHYDEHTLSVSATNPADCHPIACAGGHQGETIPHGDHYDYIVNGHLHHAHSGHCDDHGPVQLA
jgi:hypothetical protein